MDKDLMMIFTFLLALISINMYVSELGIPKQSVEAKFLDFGDKNNSFSNSQMESDYQAPESYQTSKLDVQILEVKETALLSREIRARLTNNLDDLTNVRIKLELMAGNERIKINGEDSLIIYVGNLKNGESVERVVEVSIDFFDGIKIRDKGYVDVILTILYDGGFETKSYRLRLT
jgi:hypothetical protein